MKQITRFVGVLSLVLVFAFAMVVPVLAQGENPPAQSSPFDWSAISAALQNLVVLVLTGLITLAGRWVNAKWQLERSKLSESQSYLLDGFLRVAVYAAEQMKLTEAIDDKLDYATYLVQNWLIDHNITMDVEEIRARIEAAVKEQFPHYSES